MGADDTTDKHFPRELPSESGVVERPIPLAPSIRQEFVEHRLAVERELGLMRHDLGEALARLSPVPTVGGALRRGAVAATRGGAVVVAALGLAEVVIPLVRPEWAGPLKALREAFGGP